MLTQTVEDYAQLSEDYDRIEQAILFLESNYQAQPGLSEVAASVHLSEYHFQRLFTRWVGISPKRFLQFLTKEHAKQLLAHSENVLDAAYETGLSSPGRLHDLFIATEAVTPGEFKSQGEGMPIVYGFHPTPFGESLLALTERGISDFIFVEGGDEEGALGLLRSRWRKADLRQDQRQTQPIVRRVFSALARSESAPLSIPPALPLSLYLRGTNFQIKVWQALLRIPPGFVCSYEDIARAIGKPVSAARAVGNAVGANPVSYIIPCHRVIQKMGLTGNYRWSPIRKKAILGWEAARRYQEQAA